MGPKDKQLYKKYKKIIITLINDLNQKHLLKKPHSGDKDILRIIRRMNDSGEAINNLYHLIEPKIWPKFVKDMKKYKLTEPNLLNIYITLTVHQMLDLYELLKKLILSILERKKHKSVRISGKETLGGILDKINVIMPGNKFDGCIDKKLRNALGHGWYWIENDKFYYKTTNGLILNLSFGEFYVKFRKLNLLTDCFAYDGMIHVKKELPKIKFSE